MRYNPVLGTTRTWGIYAILAPASVAAAPLPDVNMAPRIPS